MAFSISGSHRSGKSTLAQHIANDLGFHFWETKTAELMRTKGIAIVSDMGIEDRLRAQELLLEAFVEHIDALPFTSYPFICDRSPLDMLAYTLGEVTMHNTDPAIGERIHRYAETCLQVTRTYFDSVVIVRPLGHYAPASDKPPANLAYQWQIQFLIEGAFMSARNRVHGLVIGNPDFGARVEQAMNFIVERCEKLNEQRQKAHLHIH